MDNQKKDKTQMDKLKEAISGIQGDLTVIEGFLELVMRAGYYCGRPEATQMACSMEILKEYVAKRSEALDMLELS